MSAAGQAVFLSYASQDSEAAKRICDALRAAGVEVWFDQSELVGGDAWDAKIRRQIKECALLIPIISASTQARTEGYFRLEWRLADQRTHLMAKGRPFLLPIVIDDTRDAEAQVPDSFLEVQWTRLPGGAGAEKFGERVKKLLGGSTVVAGGGDPGQTAPRLVTVTAAPSRRWLLPAILGAVAIAVAAVWLTRKPASAVDPSTGRSVPATTETAPALTEAQKLVAKARAILEQGDELNRETYALAEELLIKAEALDVTEASAWVLHAKVSSSRIGYGLDRSAARYEALRIQTGRAMQLAPESLDAQLAECDALITFEQDIPAVITRLQALAAKHPDDWRVPQQLSGCYRTVGMLDEAVVANARAMQLSPDNPRLKSNMINLLVFAGHWAEAETSILGMLQGRTSARLLAHDVYLKLMWRGDLGGAATAVKSWPAWFLLEDRGVGHAALVALWNRDPGSALAVVRKFPRDYISDFLFTGPTAVLSAWANEQAGNLESARADWRVVQQVAERELKSAPNDPFALHWKAWAMARLGDTAAAASILQQLLERNPSFSAMGQFTGRLGGLALVVGRTDLALVQIGLNPPGSRAITKTDLRLNPLFDTLRSDPRFQAVIDAALGPTERKEAAVASTAPDAKSVAVLAFANLSDDKANEYFSDGISEELLNVLAKVPGLKVTARTSSFYFKGKEVPIPEIARQLGVAYVVEGSVRKQGDKVRITAQLIKAADGFHVWSDTFTRDLKDIFAVQDEIAGLVAKNLSLKLAENTGGRHAAVDARVFELYVQARQAWNLRSLAGFARAEQLLTQALEIDPGFVRGQAILIDVRQMRAYRRNEIGGFDQRNSPGHDQFLEQIRQVLALDPNLAEAHATMGVAYEGMWRYPEAEKAYRRAVELNPNYATGHHWLGMHLALDGRLEEGLAEVGLAADLDPLSPVILDNYAFLLHLAGRHREALVLFDRALALSPGLTQSSASKASVLFALGRTPEAVALAQRIEYDDSDQKIRTLVSVGQVAEATALTSAAGSDAHRYAFRPLLAAGKSDEALASLGSYFQITFSGVLDLLYQPLFDPVRGDPRFLQYLEKLGMIQAHQRARAWLATAQRTGNGEQGTVDGGQAAKP